MSLLSPIVTKSGWIYVQGALHNLPGHILGRPAYYPDPNGDRIFRGQKYSKYIIQADMSYAPVQPYEIPSLITPWCVYIPLQEIQEIISGTTVFRQWRKCESEQQKIIDSILRRSGIPLSDIGLTGSLSLGCDIEASDIDIVVYGSQNATLCLREIEKMLHRKEVYLMSEETAWKYANRYAEIYDLPKKELFYNFLLDISKVYVAGKKISFLFVYGDKETQSVPNRIYSPSNTDLKLEAMVLSSSSSWLYPRQYLLRTDYGELYSLWSHHWLHKNLVSLGTRVKVFARNCSKNLLLLSSLAHKMTLL